MKSPDPKVFEEAIFIIREDAISERGISAAKLLEEAQQIAAGYSQRKRPIAHFFTRLPAAVIAAAGVALVMGVVWLALRLLV